MFKIDNKVKIKKEFLSEYTSDCVGEIFIIKNIYDDRAEICGTSDKNLCGSIALHKLIGYNNRKLKRKVIK